MPAEEQGAQRQTQTAILTCGPENVTDFNARLRAELPEFYAIARECHRLGLIDGLRGARIGPLGSLGQGGVVPVLSADTESRLADKGKGAARP